MVFSTHEAKAVSNSMSLRPFVRAHSLLALATIPEGPHVVPFWVSYRGTLVYYPQKGTTQEPLGRLCAEFLVRLGQCHQLKVCS